MIEFDIGGRQIGKTTRLLQWLQEGEEAKEVRMYVAHSQHEADRVAKLADERNYKICKEQFIALHGLHHLKGSPAVLGIDNLDLMLYTLYGLPVRRVTATGIDLLRET